MQSLNTPWPDETWPDETWPDETPPEEISKLDEATLRRLVAALQDVWLIYPAVLPYFADSLLKSHLDGDKLPSEQRLLLKVILAFGSTISQPEHVDTAWIQAIRAELDIEPQPWTFIQVQARILAAVFDQYLYTTPPLSYLNIAATGLLQL